MMARTSGGKDMKFIFGVNASRGNASEEMI